MEWSTEVKVEAIERFRKNLPSIRSGGAIWLDRQNVARDGKEETWYLWHCKLGHLEEEALKKLTVTTVGVQLEVPERSTFEDCTVCQHLPPIKVEEVTGKRQSDRPLKLLHLYVSQAFPADCTEGKPFVIIVVDDFTNFCRVNFCQDELDMLIYLEYFVQDSRERFFQAKVDVVQVEGSTVEFFHLVLKWLKLRRIGMTTTIRQTRRTNPKAVRLLNILMRTAEALLSDCPCKDLFWGESIEAAANLFNVTTVVDGRTPYEHWFGCRPKLEKLRPFGAYVYERHEGLGQRIRYTYVGLEHDSHRVWNPCSRSVQYLSNVVAEDEYDAQNEVDEEDEGEKYGEQLKDRKQRQTFINLLSQYQESAELRDEVVEYKLGHHRRKASRRSQVTHMLDYGDLSRIREIASQRSCRPSPPSLVEKTP